MRRPERTPLTRDTLREQVARTRYQLYHRHPHAWAHDVMLTLPVLADDRLTWTATTTVIAVLKIFDIIQTMGKGGSFGTSTIANEMYEQGFPQDNEGLGAAWAVLLFLAVAPVVWVNARNQRAIREGR